MEELNKILDSMPNTNSKGGGTKLKKIKNTLNHVLFFEN